MTFQNRKKFIKYFEGSESFLTFHQIAGKFVPWADIIEEIKRHSLDAILGFLAGTTLEIIQSKNGIFDPRLQGGYLNLALVDDFPVALKKLSHLIVPGSVPNIEKTTFVHEQNMAWLCHAALLYADQKRQEYEITYTLQCRLFRLLLIINDHLNTGRIEKPFDLEKRRDFAIKWLRYSQFNRRFSSIHEILITLARQKIIMVDILPKYFPDVCCAYEKYKGITLNRYYETLTYFIANFYFSLQKGRHWMDMESVTKDAVSSGGDIKRVMGDWTVTPSKYRSNWRKWQTERGIDTKTSLYDFVQLWKYPFIEARSRQILCPVPSFLFGKVEDGPFFLLSEHLDKKELTEFHKKIGEAYADYANSLLERIALKDKSGKWSITISPREGMIRNYPIAIFRGGRQALPLNTKDKGQEQNSSRVVRATG